jgi:hypothetical protein
MSYFCFEQNRFYGESEAVLDELLSVAPHTLSYLAGNEKYEWRALLPESVFQLLPDTALR